MLSPRRSTVSTKPRSSIDGDRGGRSKPSSSQRWNGWTGSTTGGSWSPSEISRQPKPSNATTPGWNNQPWRRDSNQMASEEPGAVHINPPKLVRHSVCYPARQLVDDKMIYLTDMVPVRRINFGAVDVVARHASMIGVSSRTKFMSFLLLAISIVILKPNSGSPGYCGCNHSSLWR